MTAGKLASSFTSSSSCRARASAMRRGERGKWGGEGGKGRGGEGDEVGQGWREATGRENRGSDVAH